MRQFFASLLLTASVTGATSAVAAPSPIIGEWRSGMITVGEGFERNKVTLSFSEDLTCYIRKDIQHVFAEGSASVRSSYDCTYVLLGDQGIDMTITKRFFTVMDQPTVETANEDQFCGKSDWVVGVTRDTSALDCSNIEDPFHVGDVIKELYELSPDKKLMYIGTDLARDTIAQDPDVERNEFGRPVAVNRRIALATKGMIPPPPEPRPREDLLSGLYSVETQTFNKTSCDGPGEPVANPPLFHYAFPLKLVLPGFQGTGAKACKTREGCDVVDVGLFGLAWAAPWTAIPRKEWYSQSRSATEDFSKHCVGSGNEYRIKRSDDGSVVIEQREFKIRIPTPAPRPGERPCAKENPEITAAFDKAQCLQYGETHLKRISN